MLPLNTTVIIYHHVVVVYPDILGLWSSECNLFLHFINYYHMGDESYISSPGLWSLCI